MMLIYLLNKLNINEKSRLTQWTVIVVCLQQSLKHKECIKLNHMRFIYITWAVGSLILTACYAGNVYSLIALPQEIRVESIDDLAHALKQGYLRAILHKASNYYLFKVQRIYGYNF